MAGDYLVATPIARRLASTYRAAGVDVTREEVVADDHLGAAYVGVDRALGWLGARLEKSLGRLGLAG